jgi:hypothetical protein
MASEGLREERAGRGQEKTDGSHSEGIEEPPRVSPTGDLTGRCFMRRLVD